MITVTDVRAALGPYSWLLTVFNNLWEAVSDNRLTVAVGGSIGRLNVDEHSDVDIVVVTPNSELASAIRISIQDSLIRSGEIVTSFDNADVGLKYLSSTFVYVDRRVVKVDVAVWTRSDGPVPIGGAVLRDGVGCAYEIRIAAGQTDIEVHQAPIRLPGWASYVRARIARGELFEAAYALDAMRRRMLVPVILSRAGYPQVNYRRIEQRLSGADLDLLQATYPSALNKFELRRALVALVSSFVDLVDHTGSAPDLRAQVLLVLEGLDED